MDKEQYIQNFLTKNSQKFKLNYVLSFKIVENKKFLLEKVHAIWLKSEYQSMHTEI